MKQFYSLLLAAVLFPFLLLAQSNYKPGYIVTLRGDTLRGYIDYREWHESPRIVHFKTSLSDNQAQKITPHDYNGFSINNLETYKRYAGKVSLNQVSLTNLPTGIDTSYRVDIIFLHTVTTGKSLTLYEYSDQIKNRYYVQATNQGKPVELIRNVYLNADEGNSVVESNSYRTQLLRLVLQPDINKAGLSNKIHRLNYNESDLATIVNAINGNQQLYKSPSARVKYFVGLGITISHLKYDGDNALARTDAVNKVSVGPEFSGGMDLFKNANIGRFILRIEGSFYTSDYKVTARQVADFMRSFKQYTGVLNPQLMYNIYNKPDFKFFLSGGFMANISAYSSNQYSVTYQGYTNNDPASTGLKSLWFSFPIKAGIVLHKNWEVYAGYSFPANVADYVYFSESIPTFRAGIHYLFNRK